MGTVCLFGFPQFYPGISATASKILTLKAYLLTRLLQNNVKNWVNLKKLTVHIYLHTYRYSVFHWIPLVLFRYPGINATEAKVLTLS